MYPRCRTARSLIRVLLLLAIVQIIAASASAQKSPPASASPTPQASPTPSVERQFFKNILRDQRAIWTSPLHLRKRDTRWLIPLGLSTAALIATDRHTGEVDDDNRRNQINNVSRDISYLGSVYVTGAITGTFYLVGRAKNNARARETGVLGAEALINGYIVSQVLKNTTQRPRPREKDGRGEFFDGGRSFPSGHAVSSWALATIIAEEYRDRPFVRFSAY